jgi:hypothetical protein
MKIHNCRLHDFCLDCDSHLFARETAHDIGRESATYPLNIDDLKTALTLSAAAHGLNFSLSNWFCKEDGGGHSSDGVESQYQMARADMVGIENGAARDA